jgi:predicted AAA+ superfamily ATPase
MFIERKICKELKNHLKEKQATILVGMRRTGKTTLIKWLMSGIESTNKIYIDLERIDNREIFSEKNYDNVLLSLSKRGLDFKNKAFIAIDEIQLIPELPSVLKYLYDSYDIKFLLTGSSSYYLKNLFNESLAGRKKLFELSPLDFGEFLKFKNVNFKDIEFESSSFLSSEYERLKSYYEEYISYGGFPEVVLSANSEQKKDIISDIVSSYINLDIKTLSDFRSDKDVFNLVKLLAARIGSKIDYSKLSKISGLSRITVQSYIDFFEKTYLLKRVPVISSKPDREIVKAKKLYFLDNGFANFLAELNSGTRFENALFNQLHHKGAISYYSLKSGNEIDFILNKKIAFEAKESPTESDLKTLTELSKTAGLKKCRLIGRKSVLKFNDYIWGGDIR